MQNWYFAQDAAKHIRQVVIKLPSGACQPSKFGTLFLPVDYFPELSLQTWCAGFFETLGDDGRFLMVRADGKTERFRGASLSIAFSFCRFRAGGVVGIFVAIDSPASSRLSLEGSVVESATALDTDISGVVDRLRQLLSRDVIHICFAGAGADQTTYVEPSGRSFEVRQPHCEFDRVFPVEQSVRDTLMKEFAELETYHRSISSRQRNARRSLDQFSSPASMKASLLRE
jgi:hypothetical protein